VTPATRSICAVTGSRADYGLLLPVLRGIQQHPSLELQLVAGGSHLEPRFGHTVDAIRADGFSIDASIALGLEGDDNITVSRALARMIDGMGEVLDRLRPDLLLVLGDRYEILGAVQAALIARIPVAHIAGGDLTEGAFDDAIRHAISKMAHLHFVTNAQAAQRVRQLGEDPAHVHLSGSPGIDQLLHTPRLTQAELEQRLGMTLRRRNLAITFHPPTLDAASAASQVGQLLAALQALGDDTGLVFTGANADPAGQTVNAMVAAFVAGRDNAVQHLSLGQQAYYSLLENVDAVVGNSSSGLYEAPSFHTPTVNIGDRQQGRLKADSVIDCPPETEAIVRAIEHAWDMDCSAVQNPYGDGRATERILAVLGGPWDPAELIRKRFVDRPENS
jgi:UDP-N-acetylglucosamine 2-epimerase (non-hydrolysing)/GDP/UDP-N,N'-diacetylbacillosamine 2-epimerase (hydrolysing)